jgi:hypothetical protein
MELLTPLMDAIADWRERYKPIMENFGFFTSGGGAVALSMRRMTPPWRKW